MRSYAGVIVILFSLTFHRIYTIITTCKITEKNVIHLDNHKSELKDDENLPYLSNNHYSTMINAEDTLTLKKNCDSTEIIAEGNDPAMIKDTEVPNNKNSIVQTPQNWVDNDLFMKNKDDVPSKVKTGGDSYTDQTTNKSIKHVYYEIIENDDVIMVKEEQNQIIRHECVYTKIVKDVTKKDYDSIVKNKPESSSTDKIGKGNVVTHTPYKFETPGVCPQAEEVKPCYCSSTLSVLNIHCSNLSSIEEIRHLQHVLRDFGPVYEIKIENSRFRRIPKNIFEDIRFRSLELVNVNLITLQVEDIPFLASNSDTIQTITFFDSFKEGIGKISFSHFTKLEYLFIYGAYIRRINRHFVNGCTLLTGLGLSQNNINSINSDSFLDLLNLKTLSLSGNMIKFVDRSMLPSESNTLQLLDLSHNKITDLPKNIFYDMTAMTNVNLMENNISVMEEATWMPIWKQLTTLILSGNPLICDRQLLWMFYYDFPEDFQGTCLEPSRLKGRQITTLKIEELGEVRKEYNKKYH